MKQAKTWRTERQLSPEKTATILEGGMQAFLTCGYTATRSKLVAV
jgi:hypothetical protein